MRPAFSVILLTTLIGAGQGLFLALFTVESYATFKLLPASDSAFLAGGSLLALALLIAGLIASFFHLGQPRRAWRAASQWRTSWLSREVIVLPAFCAIVAIYGLIHYSGVNPLLATLPSGAALSLSFVFGSLGTLLAFTLFVCTAMIYACLRFLPEWHTPLTVFNYILLGGASGFTLAAALAAALLPERVGFFVGWAVLITLVGLISRLASLRRNARLKPRSTLQTALGIKHPRIVQKAQGAMGGSFNTREFRHGQTAFFLRNIKWIAIVGAFVLPCLLLAASGPESAAALATLAFFIQYLGLLAERWLFFAQANHPQNLYYPCIP
ncbi:MAG: dimethyl sulfoxide reductase anchor subunit [Azonexus sp.]|jgi:DMSO reductase anchor subunit|nr:dimethyl sulfoxide reductase anchor subunit [Azonexus sp.]